MFQEHQVVQTKEIVYHENSALPKNSRGTIIHIYTKSDRDNVYMIEFPLYDIDGKDAHPLILDLHENQIEPCNTPL